MGMDGLSRFLDSEEEKRQREIPLLLDVEPFAEAIEDERWPASQQVRVIMPGVRISRKRDKYGALNITQRGIIPTKDLTVPVFVQPDFSDPLDLLLAKEAEELKRPPSKRIGRLRAKQAAMDVARPRKLLLQSWVPAT